MFMALENVSRTDVKNIAILSCVYVYSKRNQTFSVSTTKQTLCMADHTYICRHTVK